MVSVLGTSLSGRKLSDETRARISASRKKPPSYERRETISREKEETEEATQGRDGQNDKMLYHFTWRHLKLHAGDVATPICRLIAQGVVR